MQNKFLITSISILGLLFGIVGLVMSFLPLGTIDLIPSICGLFIGGVIFLLTKKSRIRRKLVLSVIFISFLAILISLFTVLFMENKVAEDLKFEEKQEQSVEEASEDLEEALEDLEDLEDSEDSEDANPE